MTNLEKEKEVLNNFIKCSGCDLVLECKERGQHSNCIKYKPRDKSKD